MFSIFKTEEKQNELKDIQSKIDLLMSYNKSFDTTLKNLEKTILSKNTKKLIVSEHYEGKVLADLMKRCKSGNKEWIYDVIRRVQNYRIINGKIILLDGPVNKKQLKKDRPENDQLKNLFPYRLFYIASKVDPKLKISKIKFDKEIENKITYKNMYAYNENYDVHNLTIDPVTCRPFYDKNWKDKSEFLYSNHFVSMYKFFGDYVCRYKKYPTTEDLIVFSFEQLNKKYKNYDDLLTNYVTLPRCIFEITNSIILDYKDIIETLEPIEFRKRYLISLDPKKR